MKHTLIFFLVIFNSSFFVFSVVQQWNFENSSKDLLSSSEPLSVPVLEETKDNLFVKLYKYLAKENGAVVYRKYLTVTYNNNPVFDGEVNFDKIESFHRFDNDNIICPKGKYHPTYFYSNTFSTLSLSEFKDNGDWELKCISHEQGYFLVFYLMNGESHFFYKKAGTWGHQKLHSEKIWR